MRKEFYKTIIIAGDLLITFFIWVLFYFLRQNILDQSAEVDLLVLTLGGLFAVFFWYILYLSARFYRDIYRKSRVKSILHLVALSVVGSIVLFIGNMLDDNVQHYKDYYKLLGLYLGIHLGVMILWKTISLTYLKSLLKSGKVFFNTLIVGAGDSGLDVYKELKKVDKRLGYRFVGCVSTVDGLESPLVSDLRCLGDLTQLKTIIRRGRIQEVIIALDTTDHNKISEILTVLQEFDIGVNIKPDVYQMLIGSVKVNHLMGAPLIQVDQELMSPGVFLFKRIFDISFALFSIVVASPILIFTAIMTRMSSPGPILFKQIRIGKSQKAFYIFKFRSMVQNAEELGKPQLSSDQDSRITKWGRVMRKTRLDELPQFWNVIKGDMSIVGPRPERNFFIKEIEKKAPYYRQILKVKPGITSLGQVKYGYAENVDEMVKRLSFDIIYIENMSIAMDFRILLLTILIVIQGRGK